MKKVNTLRNIRGIAFSVMAIAAMNGCNLELVVDGNGTKDATSTNSLGDGTTTENVAVGKGAARLDWIPPTTRTDGTALTDISTYRIYYGTDPNKLTTVKDAPTGITSMTIDNLEPATYYFEVTAADSSGIESQPSNRVSKLVD